MLLWCTATSEGMVHTWGESRCKQTRGFCHCVRRNSVADLRGKDSNDQKQHGQNMLLCRSECHGNQIKILRPAPSFSTSTPCFANNRSPGPVDSLVTSAYDPTIPWRACAQWSQRHGAVPDNRYGQSCRPKNAQDETGRKFHKKPC